MMMMLVSIEEKEQQEHENDYDDDSDQGFLQRISVEMKLLMTKLKKKTVISWKQNWKEEKKLF